MVTSEPRPFIVASYGGGTNSTALIVEAVNRGIHLDAIIFSDTGSEMPHTYEYIATFQRWLAQHGLTLEIVRWIRRDGRFVPLHEASLAANEMPSRAYGFSGCTSKWKQQPADKRAAEIIAERAGDRPVQRWLGYDADEPRRVANLAPKSRETGHLWRAPLAEWGVDREECREIIAAAGLPQPGKSACWMCPSMREHEIRRMRDEYPHLFDLAVQIERRARANPKADGVPKERGLGMNLSPRRPWEDLDNVPQPKQCGLFEDDNDSAPCGCHD